ncbi:MAG: hypothetical protein B7Z55_09960 [Planctomycetales bacterium 12-60-4]|nr:MAG: hypothetical protein B7Z55_09960 [Planctomycetales bacterium 12-60-4]
MLCSGCRPDLLRSCRCSDLLRSCCSDLLCSRSLLRSLRQLLRQEVEEVQPVGLDEQVQEEQEELLRSGQLLCSGSELLCSGRSDLCRSYGWLLPLSLEPRTPNPLLTFQVSEMREAGT